MVFCYQNFSVRKNCSSDREKVLKFEVEGRQFANFLRSLEQFIRTVKGQNNVWLSLMCSPEEVVSIQRNV